MYLKGRNYESVRENAEAEYCESVGCENYIIGEIIKQEET